MCLRKAWKTWKFSFIRGAFGSKKPEQPHNHFRDTAATVQTLHSLSIFPVTSLPPSLLYLTPNPLWVSDKTLLPILQPLFPPMLNVRINSLCSSGQAVLVNQLPQLRNVYCLNAVCLSIFPVQPCSAVGKIRASKISACFALEKDLKAF